MIRHEQGGEFFFIFWRGLRFQEMKLNLVYLFVRARDYRRTEIILICRKMSSNQKSGRQRFKGDLYQFFFSFCLSRQNFIYEA